MATTIVNSYNFYFDSERDINGASTGDNVHISLNETPIQAAQNQFLRLSLQAFSMYRSSTNVNPTNCIFRVSCTPATTGTTLINQPKALDCGNFTKIQIMQDLGLKVAEAIQVSTGVTFPPTSLANPTGIFHMNREFTSASPTSSDNILRVRLDYGTTPHLIQAGNLVIQCLVDDGDCFELIGGNRKYNLDTTGSIFVDTTTSTTRVDIYGYYGVQESTQQNTYLYCNLNSTAIQTKSYSSRSTDKRDESAGTESSRILGRIINNTDFNTFTTETQMEYFLNLTNKTLNFIELSIADSHGRPIPPNVNYVLDPVAGSGSGVFSPVMKLDTTHVPAEANSQNTLGNRSFEGCIKVDVVQQMSAPNNTLTAPPPRVTINPRLTSNLLSQTKQPSDYLTGY
tara:strand:- start:111 stop:1304 length:1194 start_codon:yes stop_codon:yes gene_type:complete